MSDGEIKGRLFIVATPIGNLEDITRRAVNVLMAVPIVAAEDTRRSGHLLTHLGASPERLLSLHDHNESTRTEVILGLLQGGSDVALVSDAGTPLVSDPGFELVRAAHAAGIEVVPIPGPSALIAVVSGALVPIERFYVEGFLPPRRAQSCTSSASRLCSSNRRDASAVPSTTWVRCWAGIASWLSPRS